MKEQTKRWLEMAEYDLETARVLFTSRRYIYSIFMCHLCLEKGLKACIVEYMDVFPPRTHNLGRLAEAARLELPPGFAEFIFRLSDESVRTRYPEEYRVRYTKATAQRYLQKTEEAFLWLRQKLTSRP